MLMPPQRLCRVGLLATLLAYSSGVHAQSWKDAETWPTYVKITVGKCQEAAAEVNAGLAKKRPLFQFLAATMYENGECAEANWETAAQFYQQAHQSGIERALPRLVSLFAVNSRDPAAALWWASQRPQVLPQACVPKSDPVKQAAAFVEEMRDWPADRLKACVYSAGVAFRIWSEAGYIPETGRGDLEDVLAVFKPGAGTIEWIEDGKRVMATSRWQPPAPELDVSSAPNDENFKFNLWSLGTRTLQEFGQAPPADPAWTVSMSYKLERPIRSTMLPTIISIQN